MDSVEHIKRHQLVAILRGTRLEDIVPVAKALSDGGIKTLEVTLNTPRALEMIEILAEVLRGSVLVGAGTALTTHDVSEAIKVGAKFIISPHTDPSIIRATKDLGAVSIPGAFTPTEILQAHQYGGDIIKVFPATNGADYISDIRGPLPHIPLMPTGGVNIRNIEAFKNAGAVAFGIGSALVNSQKEVSPEYLSQLSHVARQYLQAVQKH